MKLRLTVKATLLWMGVIYPFASFGQSQKLPEAAEQYRGIFIAQVEKVWPTLKTPWRLAGQTEQETCSSLKSKKCWNPRTENIQPKNNGEYGWGLSQLTNTNSFSTFNEIKVFSPELKAWKWEDRFNPALQIQAMAYTDKRNFDSFKAVPREEDKLAFAFVGYNAGLGSVIRDRKYCAQFKDCDPNVWFGNVETHSLKKRTSLSGYNVSPYQISRDYPHNIMLTRSDKYAVWWGKTPSR